MTIYTEWQYSNALGYSAVARRVWPHGPMEFLQSPEVQRPWRFLSRLEAESKAQELNYKPDEDFLRQMPGFPSHVKHPTTQEVGTITTFLVVTK